jgi:hypothetical protein
MPACGCGNPELYLLGFELAPDLRTVMVNYKCARCGKTTRSKYAEAPDKLRDSRGLS